MEEQLKDLERFQKAFNSTYNETPTLLSEEDWKAIEETLYLNSIPNMVSSIKDSMNEDDSEFSETIEW